MYAEVNLSDGTKLKTEENMSAEDVIGRIRETSRPDWSAVGFVAIHTFDGKTVRVNPLQIVSLRDVVGLPDE
ncbi:MAG TPA: hypothetical protein VE985_02075 [Gaiellaceae bacterium]|nr:hypothetical protein [Gaiellaceae bacterium]